MTIIDGGGWLYALQIKGYTIDYGFTEKSTPRDVIFKLRVKWDPYYQINITRDMQYSTGFDLSASCNLYHSSLLKLCR
jgi:hypothetical protein